MRGRGRAVDLVVGGHDQRGARFGHARLERRQVQLAQHLLADDCVVAPALGLGVVADEVLGRGRHPGRLQAGDEGDGHPGGQHRVLGEALEPAAAQRRPHQVDGGRQQHVHALAAGLRAQRGGELGDQLGVPGRAGRGCARQAGRGMTLILGDAPDPGGPVRHDHRPEADGGGALGAPVGRTGQQSYLVLHGERGEQGLLGWRPGAGRGLRAVNGCGHLPGRSPGRAGSAPHARYSCVELSSFRGPVAVTRPA